MRGRAKASKSARCHFFRGAHLLPASEWMVTQKRLSSSRLGDSSALEFLDPRSHFYFPRPSTAWLAQHGPIVGGNRIRIEHGVWFVGWLGPHCAANAAVDDEMRNVDSER